MKKIFVTTIILLSMNVFGYVPTVESLFRHGGNPDVSASSVALNIRVSTEKKDEVGGKVESFFKLYLTKAGQDSLRISQARYDSVGFIENEINHKFYLSNFSGVLTKDESLNVERGLFWGILRSIYFNDGRQLVNLLKTLGAKVSLNDEILNREKIELLVDYKKYLISSAKFLNQSEANPLRPVDPTERSEVDKLLNQSMYSDFNQVKLVKVGEEMLWGIDAEVFWGLISFEKRHPVRIKYKFEGSDTEISFLNYYMFDGIHYGPKDILIKTAEGEVYNLEIINARYFNEKEEDALTRIRRWDQFLKNKKEFEPRPKFLF